MNETAQKRERPPLPPGPYLVVGLARSGAAAARLLAERDERVFGCDSGTPEGAAGLAELGVEVSLDDDGTGLLGAVKTVVKSPGVPRSAPAVAAALERGHDVIGELELAWRAIPNRFCAVTGTNGKTTTVELIGHIHRSAGMPVAVAGNVGTPLSSLAGRIEPEATVVCEASSFQLEDSVDFAPETAVFLNLAADHLDRHGTIDSYLDAKLRIFANQGNDDTAIYNREQPELRDRDLGGCARRVGFCPTSTGDPDCGVSRRGEVIFADDEPLLEVEELDLLGDHNVENAMAAAAASLAAGIARGDVAAGLASFPGVPHRLERIATIAGTSWINDSKATNVASAIAGIRAFDGGLRLILGGQAKDESFAPLGEVMAGRVSAAYLIGPAAERIRAEAGSPEGVELIDAGDLERAVALAAAASEVGDVVLLSPACASFDAYPDFEHRGDHFRHLVEGLR